MLRAANQVREVAARIDGTDNQVGIVDLRGSMVPIGVKDGANGLDILSIGIDDAIFAISSTTAATGAA